jgi:hypothetical protein
MLMISGGYKDAKPGIRPDPKMVEKMGAFNKELDKAGVLLGLNGLHPPASGARVKFAEDQATQLEPGPFPETTETVGGYWIIQVGSQSEVIEWAKRCPANAGDVIEIRQIFEP